MKYKFSKNQYTESLVKNYKIPMKTEIYTMT